MQIDKLFPSKYLTAADLNGQSIRATIAGVTPEQMGQNEIKPCVMFAELQKRLVLNKTNGLTIASLHGTETDHWIGKVVELYSDKVMVQGEIKDCIRVREARASAPARANTSSPSSDSAPPETHNSAAQAGQRSAQQNVDW